MVLHMRQTELGRLQQQAARAARLEAMSDE